MSGLNDYEQKLLSGWEEVHKKSQLTLWVLLALKDHPKHMASIKQFIEATTHGTLTADDQSMYRALRRYHEADLVDFREEPSESGPDLKVYFLTTTGERVLSEFINRNIAGIYYEEAVRGLIEK